MPRRPLPNIPRLKTPSRRIPQSILLGCPRISPEWELAALAALLKPQTKDAILHRPAEQKMPAGMPEKVARVVDSFAVHTGYRPTLHWPPAGDYYFAASIAASELTYARSLALAISQSLPTLWLTVDRLFVHDAKFFRRKRRTELHLAPAKNISIPRHIRAALASI